MLLLAFRRVKVDLEAIRDPVLRERHGPAPRFLILDPRGRVIGDVSGKRATSLSAFCRLCHKVWGTLFTIKCKAYARKMQGSFEREDLIQSREMLIRHKRERLAKIESPEERARKAAALDEAAAETARMRDEMETKRRKILARCVLRPECRAPPRKKDK